jgi:hypothetical protein
MDVAIIDMPWNGIWQGHKIAAMAEAYRKPGCWDAFTELAIANAILPESSSCTNQAASNSTS